MATTCLDKEFCENAWDCSIAVLDLEGNPINPLYINDYQSVMLVLGDKPGYRFVMWLDENENPVPFTHGNLPNSYIINVNCDKKYFAQYCPINYAVTFTSDPYFYQCTEYVTAQYGTVVSKTAVNVSNYHFVKWTRDGADITENETIEHVVTGNAVLVAVYEPFLYRITVKPNNKNYGTCSGSGNYAINSQITISASPYYGYSFIRWGDNNSDATRQVTVGGNMTYKAIFEPNNNIVSSPHVTGGTVIGTGTYRTGEPVTLQPLPEQGWKFSYWEYGINRERIDTKDISFIISENINVIPHFEMMNYMVRLYVNNSSYGYFSPYPSSLFSYGDSFTTEAVPYEGYRFVQWDDGFDLPRRTVNVMSNVTLKAFFAPNPVEHTVTISLPDDTYSCYVYCNGTDVGTKSNDTVTVHAVKGNALTIAPVVPKGERIVSVVDGDDNVVWENNGSGRETIRFVVGDSDSVLKMSFEALEYTLKVTMSPLNEETSGNALLSIGYGNSLDFFTPSLQFPYYMTHLTYGTELGLTAPATIPVADGSYTFMYWATSNGSFSEGSTSVSVIGDTVCTAVYAYAQQPNINS